MSDARDRDGNAASATTQGAAQRGGNALRDAAGRMAPLSGRSGGVDELSLASRRRSEAYGRARGRT